MKTIETSRLYYKDERSDKVYEVDLCETAPGKYVVNFRYGRNGGRLIEGTKTVFPVEFEEAKKIFDKLVDSKVKKGYSPSGEAPEVVEETTIIPSVVVEENDRNTERDAVIAGYIKQMVSGSYAGNWTVSRVIYRAGVLKVPGVAADLAVLLGNAKDIEGYSIIWALTRLNSAVAHERIFSLLGQTAHAPTRRIALAHLLTIEGSGTAEARKKVAAKIPGILRDILPTAGEEQLSDGIATIIGSTSKETPELLVDLYLLSIHSPTLRKAVHRQIERLALRVNVFKGIRHIYKISEMIEDWPTYALCSKRIALSEAGYASSAYYAHAQGDYFKVSEEKGKMEPRIAFSSGTKHYLNKRSERTLKAQEQESDAAYRTLAKAILLSLDDEKDDQSMRRDGRYVYMERWVFLELFYPKYEKHRALQSILYGRSERFATLASGERAAYFAPAQHSRPEADVPREEARPEIWDKAPRDIIDLLRDSRAEQVNEFALKVFKANSSFRSQVTGEDLTHLLTSFHLGTVRHFLVMVREMIAEGMPDFDIVLALLSSETAEVFQLGEETLERYAAIYLAESENLAALIALGRIEVLDLLMKQSVMPVKGTRLSVQDIQPLIENESDYSDTYYQALCDFIRSEKWAFVFADMGLAGIDPLLSADRGGVVQLGLTLCLVNPGPSHTIVGETIDDHLASDHAGVRSAAVALLGRFPDDYLKEKGDEILSFAFSTYPEVREYVEPVILRLIDLVSDRRADLYHRLIHSVSGAETSPGIHDDHLDWLTTHFVQELDAIDQETVISLLLSDVDPAQKIGERSYREKNMADRLLLTDWIRLGDCDVVAIRQAIGEYYDSHVEEINGQLDTSLKVLDAKWMDVRNRAFDYFLTKTESGHWSLDLVLMVVDNPREDVQAFGRSLISRLFSAAEGRELMLHMSEHPSRSMMLFTSNYLELHAKDEPEIVLQLAQYFKNILFGVNVGAASKSRVFAFLEQESEKNAAVAGMTAELLGEIMATVSMKDKERSLSTLLAIHAAHPDVSIPIDIHPVKPYADAVRTSL